MHQEKAYVHRVVVQDCYNIVGYCDVPQDRSFQSRSKGVYLHKQKLGVNHT